MTFQACKTTKLQTDQTSVSGLIGVSPARLPSEETSEARTIRLKAATFRMWTDGVLPYKLDAAFTSAQKTKIREVMKVDKDWLLESLYCTCEVYTLCDHRIDDIIGIDDVYVHI